MATSEPAISTILTDVIPHPFSPPCLTLIRNKVGIIDPVTRFAKRRKDQVLLGHALLRGFSCQRVIQVDWNFDPKGGNGSTGMRAAVYAAG